MDGGSSSDREQEKPPEGGGGGGGGSGSGGEPKVKRKMKTAAQLEVLERTYQVETYPSESLRAELSIQLNLSDRQLQMWFCHRRLKDRKMSNNTTSTPPSSSNSKQQQQRLKKVEDSPATASIPTPLPLPSSSTNNLPPNDMDIELGNNDHGSGSGSGSSPYRQKQVETRRGGIPRTGVAVPRISHGRYYDPPPQPVAEVRAISYIEAQLGEPLRDDGPALGVEFDPLPPGAFGAPIVASGARQNQPNRAYEQNVYERPNAKPIKGHGRALHEYQFLPEQPTVRGDAYERGTQSHYYGSPSDGLSGRATTSSSGRPAMHGAEEISGYGYQAQVPSLSLVPHQGKHNHLLPSAKEEFDGISRRTPYMGMSMGSPYSGHPITGMDGAAKSEQHAMQEEEIVRVDRKRKSEEARLQKEAENQEKRMRRELEKQEMIRRKKEEQMQKEMEKLRKREEEKMLRDQQREKEKYQKEQKREMERQEKLMRRESERAEKLRQKEEQRRVREAARQKAANDRAAARRIAKESMELIEDERLELMEIAASQKGLTSIMCLDSETLENLELFRDMLSDFPPKAVLLKRPLAVEPWVDSEKNVGNLLMLWRFLITFADVLGLWPFTLDEFIQAFHDYDPRVLGEIHIALLKVIIKDIEDAARTPSSGLGANQYSVSNPSGGHPHVVEGAYAWGFDIQSWQSNLGPLTWPEILRQFALSAGFGPKLSKRNIESAYVRDDTEGNDGMNVISNLRTGAAVENAVAIMQERGYSKPRKSRHRLTPGTVKFAAFHVLSLEGNNGLNILEVADRIQKSGLRDLTTSKTPEASIAAALSRDTKLFERVAPSTYCVKTPYRKDPADAEAILSAAREKIRIFKSGFVDGIEAEDVEKDDEDVEKEDDDVEKDDDSESDTAEDPEVDDFGIELVSGKDGNPSYDAKSRETHVANGAETDVCDVATTSSSQNWKGNGGEDVPVWGSVQGLSDLNGPGVASHDQITGGTSDETAGTSNQEDTDIDESSPGELWVQGLMEGEYSNLSVEERLGALVALFEVAIEGNAIRLVLEERLEAANALKKQMWSEAQLDKRKLKEDNVMKSQYPGFAGNIVEACVTTENRQSPLVACEEKGNEACPGQLLDLENKQIPKPEMLLENMNVSTEINSTQDNTLVQQSLYAAERSRTQMKSYIGYKAEEMYVYRSLPLGMDRRRNRYWQFIASASSSDPGSGRIFVELKNGSWRLIDSEEAFDALISSLDVRGAREAHLVSLLQKIEALFRQTAKKRIATGTSTLKDDVAKIEIFTEGRALNPDDREDSPNSSICASNSNSPETSCSFQIESGRNKGELKGIVRRYKECEEWMWKECLMSSRLRATKHGKKRDQLLGVCDSCHDLYFFEDNHCPSCHRTFPKNVGFSDHRAHCEGRSKMNPTETANGLGSMPTPPPRIRLLKAHLSVVEAALPTEALQPFWSDKFRMSWGLQLYRSSSAEELIQMVTVLEGAVNKEYLSANFPKTVEILGLSDIASRYSVGGSLNLRAVKVLPWIPQTTAAVALRLTELDSLISYVLPPKEEPQKDVKSGEIMKPPSKFTIVRSNNKGSEVLNPDCKEFTPEDIWSNPGNVPHNNNRSKGGRGKGGGRVRASPASTSGGRSQKKVSSSRSLASTPGSNSERMGPVVLSGWKSRSARGQGGKKRSRRTSRSRKKPAKKAVMGGSTSTAGNRNRDDEFRRPVVFDQLSSHGMDEDREEEEDEWMGEQEPMQEMQRDEHGVDVGDENDSNNSERSMEFEEEDNGLEAYVDDEDEYELGGDDRYQRRAYSSGKAPLADEEDEEPSDDQVEEEEEEEEEDDGVELGGASGGYEGGYQQRGYSGGQAGGVYRQEDDAGAYYNAESSDDDDDDGDDDATNQYNISQRGATDQYSIAQRGVGGSHGGGDDWNRSRDNGSGSDSGSTDYSD